MLVINPELHICKTSAELLSHNPAFESSSPPFLKLIGEQWLAQNDPAEKGGSRRDQHTRLG